MAKSIAGSYQLRSPLFAKRGKFAPYRGDDNGIPFMRRINRGLPKAAMERDFAIASMLGMSNEEPCECCHTHKGQLCIDCIEGGCP